ncbi:RING-H2 finger protein ATL13-like [Durio zibethinus]|uniref:RING-type E3 ubiquitin transferase n=1 Tax=Durio zibethinus TaxID=66656 RepID=A0A6P5ZGK4_DURZI|nr:RING-H2 finger protein ATL13-like [Durio zibethinus]
MDRIFHEIKQRSLLSPSEQPYYFPQSPALLPAPQNLQSDSFNLNNKVSPSILLVIIILATIFFVSGLLHLLVRFLWRTPNRAPEDIDNVTARQGQLQQLFHLHDAGVDQSFIDTLPVFHYKAIIGVKNPFDCAICLCEFEPEDKLRLLPKCSHAFHMECIDTWLLSHSTCPLCRASLLPDFSPNNSSPIVLVLESGSESSREIFTDREGVLGRTSSVLRSNSHLGLCGDTELGSSQRKSCEILEKEEANPTVVGDSGEKVVPVRLGKFRNVDVGEGSSSNNVDARRCFSMGSFEYVMDENSFLQVPIRTPMKKPSSKKTSLPLTPGHFPAMSECDCESRRGFNGFEIMRNFETNGSSSTSDNNCKAIGKRKKESFSISKIWLHGKKDKQNFAENSTRRAFSFRFPLHQNVAASAATDDSKKVKNGIAGARDTVSEIDSGSWGNAGSEFGCDEENQSCYSLDSQAKTPSFARRTLLWLAGKQNKVVHSSFTPKI